MEEMKEEELGEVRANESWGSNGSEGNERKGIKGNECRKVGKVRGNE